MYRAGGGLEGKVAVVTGAARGIGRAVALALARRGASAVVVLDVREQEGEETARLVQEAGAPAGTRGLFRAVDVSAPRQVEEAARWVESALGRCDVLVNNAGISGRPIGDGPVHRCTLEAWERVIAVNLTGVFLVSRYFVPLLMRSGGGAVINVASDEALVGAPPPTDTHAYAASKGGVVALTRAMAVSLAPHRIRVNAVAPGWVATPMTADLLADPAEAERIARACPMGRVAVPDEIASVVAFLASDEASFMTGAIVPVEGGSTAW